MREVAGLQLIQHATQFDNESATAHFACVPRCRYWLVIICAQLCCPVDSLRRPHPGDESKAKQMSELFVGQNL
jgi:hypothetical protein